MAEAEGDTDIKAFLKAWSWKREHRPDKVRFYRPYKYKMQVPHSNENKVLTIRQAKFEAEGFASTVWDSSIVMGKFFEREAHQVRGRRCLDLSAGCGLVGIVLANLGALVTLTDLAGNLPLLQENVDINDVMYIIEAIPALVRTLCAVSDVQTTRVFLAHGRNRQAEATFLEQCQPHFTVHTLDSSELHPDFHSVDIDVLELRLRH